MRFRRFDRCSIQHSCARSEKLAVFVNMMFPSGTFRASGIFRRLLVFYRARHQEILLHKVVMKIFRGERIVFLAECCELGRIIRR